jgi:hypothetical protein
MPYTTPAARRAVLGAILGLVVGCSAATTAPTPDATDRQAAFNPTLTPTQASLAPGGTLTFTASSPEKATWLATGGTIDASGNYTAPSAAGIYRVIARWPSHQRSDTAVVTVVSQAPPPPPPAPTPAPALTSLAIAPDSLWLTQRDTFALVAVSVMWYAAGGTITSTGLFTAGMTAGTYGVWCDLAAPTWNGSPVLFARQSAFHPRLAPMPLTGSAAVQVN